MGGSICLPACLGGYDATIIACWVMRREGSIGRRAEGDGRAAGRARRVAVDGYIPAAAPPVAVVSLSVPCTSVSAVCRARGCSSWSRREQLEVYLKRALRGLMFFFLSRALLSLSRLLSFPPALLVYNWESEMCADVDVFLCIYKSNDDSGSAWSKLQERASRTK